MGQPITWQGLRYTADNTAGTNLLGMAQKSINNAFDPFEKILQQQEGFAANQAGMLREANKQAFLEALSQAKTPEALAQLQASGQLDAMKARLTPESLAAVRGADEARLTSLRDQVGATQKFDDARAEFALRPLKEAIGVNLAAGTKEGYAKARELALQIPEGRGRDLALDGIYKAELARNASDRGEALAAARQPGQLADVKFADEQRPIVQKATAVNNNTAVLTADAAAKQARDAALIDRTLTPHLAKFNADSAATMDQLRGLKGYPVDRDGMPDPAQMNPEQLTRFKGEVANIKAPSATQYTANFKADLAKAGVSAAGIAKAVGESDALFKSKGALSTEDVGRVAARSASIDAAVAEATATNPFYTPPNQLSAAKTAVLGKINSEIKDGPMTVTRLREKVGEWMDSGMEFQRDGKSVKVPIPPKVIEQAFAAGKETDTWMVNSTDNNMEKLIRQFMTDPQNVALRSQADWLYADGHKHAARDFQMEIQRAAGTQTPTDYLENFQRVIDQRTADIKAQPFKYAPPLVDAKPATTMSGRGNSRPLK